MRPSLQHFMNKIKGKTVFMVGGGDSISSMVDFSLLQNELVFCINDSYMDIITPVGLYWVDDTWMSERYEKLKEYTDMDIFTSKTASHINYDIKNDPRTLGNTIILKRISDFGYAPDFDTVCGNNSGVQALNFVVNMSPSNVILLGYDMRRGDTGRTHYHDEYRPHIPDDVYSTLFLPSINKFAKEYKESGKSVNIYNANPDSAVRCFNFCDYRDFIKEK